MKMDEVKKTMKKRKVVVWYDAENENCVRNVPKIINFIEKNIGHIIYQDAIGQYTRAWENLANEHSINLTYKPRNGRKEVADKAIITAAIEYSFHHKTVSHVFVSSDADFYDVIESLKGRNIEAFGIGKKEKLIGKKRWMDACTCHYFIEGILNGTCMPGEEREKPLNSRTCVYRTNLTSNHTKNAGIDTKANAQDRKRIVVTGLPEFWNDCGARTFIILPQQRGFEFQTTYKNGKAFISVPADTNCYVVQRRAPDSDTVWNQEIRMTA